MAGGLITLWVTFLPCFLWIFIGAPYLDWISAQPRLTGALRAITAAVVGVILNLSLWFALHVLFETVDKRQQGPLQLWVPDMTTLNWSALGLIALAALLVLRLRLAIGWSLGLSASAALVLAHV